MATPLDILLPFVRASTGAGPKKRPPAGSRGRTPYVEQLRKSQGSTLLRQPTRPQVSGLEKAQAHELYQEPVEPRRRGVEEFQPPKGRREPYRADYADIMGYSETSLEGTGDIAARAVLRTFMDGDSNIAPEVFWAEYALRHRMDNPDAWGRALAESLDAIGRGEPVPSGFDVDPTMDRILAVARVAIEEPARPRYDLAHHIRMEMELRGVSRELRDSKAIQRTRANRVLDMLESVSALDIDLAELVAGIDPQELDHAILPYQAEALIDGLGIFGPASIRESLAARWIQGENPTTFRDLMGAIDKLAQSEEAQEIRTLARDPGDIYVRALESLKIHGSEGFLDPDQMPRSSLIGVRKRGGSMDIYRVARGSGETMSGTEDARIYRIDLESEEGRPVQRRMDVSWSDFVRSQLAEPDFDGFQVVPEAHRFLWPGIAATRGLREGTLTAPRDQPSQLPEPLERIPVPTTLRPLSGERLRRASLGVVETGTPVPMESREPLGPGGARVRVDPRVRSAIGGSRKLGSGVAQAFRAMSPQDLSSLFDQKSDWRAAYGAYQRRGLDPQQAYEAVEYQKAFIQQNQDFWRGSDLSNWTVSPDMTVTQSNMNDLRREVMASLAEGYFRKRESIVPPSAVGVMRMFFPENP